jgi:hypothetical protein
MAVEPQNHPALRMVGFTGFGPQNSAVWFPQEPETTHGIIVKGVSRRSNFMWSAWPSDAYSKRWSIFLMVK